MGRRVLLIVDVQEGFMNENTLPVVDFIKYLVSKGSWDLIVQSRWENCKDSRYEEQLGYRAMASSKDTDLVIKLSDDKVISRCAYSCVNDELLRMLEPGDEIYVCGLETDACILAALFRLWDLGFKFYVYEDGVGTSAENLSQPALELIRRQFGKGSVL